MNGAVLLAAVALLGASLATGGARRMARFLPPLVALAVALASGLAVALAAAASVALWQAGLRQYLRHARLRRLAVAAEEPIQAMFEQASLYGSAELCALAALPACSDDLRPLWQSALADWLRGGSSEAAFADVGQRAGIGLLVRLARALALSRHTGAPLDRHLAVLLEDAADDRREVASVEGETLPYFVVTGLMATALLFTGLVLAAEGNAPIPWLIALALVTGGGVPYLASALLP
jgi:hypothetical protein